MFNLSNPISVVFHFALMQNETKNQGSIPRRPKTAASVEQNNRESFFVCLLAEYSSHRILLYTSALRIGCPACGTRSEPRCGQDRGPSVFSLTSVSLSAFVPQAGYPHGADGVERDGAIARLSLSAGKPVVGRRGT